MDWLALAVLGIIWAVLLVPMPGRREPFNPLRRKMPTEEEEFRQPGRWILSPKRGSRFMGTRARARVRARERRRRVFLFLLEVVGVTGLIGMFPPLRGMLVLTGVVAVILGIYTVLVLRVRLSGRRVTTGALPDGVVVLPEVRRPPDPMLQEQDRRVVRLAR